MRKSIMLAMSLLVVMSLIITACGPTPEPVIQEVPVEVTRVVVETQVVQGAEVEVTRIIQEEVIKEVVVTATAAPVVKEEAPDVLGLPRSETFIAGILTGHIGAPGNFNEWVGWKWRDRGMQNLANEPLWSVDFATGEIINGLAAGDPVYNEEFTEVTIPLREGVAWHDGEPFTSADVVFTIELIMSNEGFNAHNNLVENVASVSAPDDYTVHFELTQPNEELCNSSRTFKADCRTRSSW
jgi:ABC-type transport system substrate-binding protein